VRRQGQQLKAIRLQESCDKVRGYYSRNKGSERKGEHQAEGNQYRSGLCKWREKGVEKPFKTKNLGGLIIGKRERESEQKDVPGGVKESKSI